MDLCHLWIVCVRMRPACAGPLVLCCQLSRIRGALLVLLSFDVRTLTDVDRTGRPAQAAAQSRERASATPTGLRTRDGVRVCAV